MDKNDEKFMTLALHQARLAKKLGEVPVGAVIVKDNKVIAKSHNSIEADKCAINHAEIKAIQQASKYLNDWRLNDCTMYVTLEPCAMCSGAIIRSRIKRLVIGAMEEKNGFCGSVLNICDDGIFNHRVKVETGLLADQSSNLLRGFFKGLRYEK